MAEDLGIEIIRARLGAFLDDLLAQVAPKTVAHDLTSRGWPYEESAVRAWRTTASKRNTPPGDVLLALASIYGRSLDAYVHGEALEAKFADRLEEHERRLDEQQEWLRELASSLGLELGKPLPAETIPNLSLVRVQREVADLREVVERLGGQDA